MTERPKKQPGKNCNAKKRQGTGYCGLPAGWGTDHVGEGRCRKHGGNNAKGQDAGNYKHGLYSKYLDKDTKKRIEELHNQPLVEKLMNVFDRELARYERAEERYKDIAESPGSKEEREEKSHLFGLLATQAERVTRIAKQINEISEGININLDHDLSAKEAEEALNAPFIWEQEQEE